MKHFQSTIGNVSQASGVHVETIRYYERIGLIPRPDRSGGGQRVYRAEDQQRLIFIRRCRELGFSLDDIRALLDLAETEDRTCREVKDMTETHLRSVRRKIADLRRMERTLGELSRSCDGGSSPDCPIIARLFA